MGIPMFLEQELREHSEANAKIRVYKDIQESGDSMQKVTNCVLKMRMANTADRSSKMKTMNWLF